MTRGSRLGHGRQQRVSVAGKPWPVLKGRPWPMQWTSVRQEADPVRRAFCGVQRNRNCEFPCEISQGDDIGR